MFSCRLTSTVTDHCLLVSHAPDTISLSRWPLTVAVNVGLITAMNCYSKQSLPNSPKELALVGCLNGDLQR